MTIPAPTNPAFVIDDGLTLHAPTGGGEQTQYGIVSAAPYIFEFGTDPWFGMAVFEGSVLEVAAGQTYHLYIEGNAEADFSGTPQELGNWAMGVINPQDIIALSNMYNETVYPYGRLKIVMTGTGPQIKLKAFIRSLLDEPPQDLSDKISTDIVLSQNIQNAVTNLLGWMAGPAFGGPGLDGRYPIADGTGNTVYRYSPDQIAANGSLLTPENFGAVGDGLSHPASGTFATLADCQVVYPFATSLAQELDFLAWQKAIYTRRKIGAHPKYYRMNNSDPASHTTLTVIAGNSWVETAGCAWVFDQMVAVTTDEHLYADYDFATGAGWENATIWSPELWLATTFDTGEAVMIDTGSGDATQATFFQWGRLLTAVPPGRYTVSWAAEATRGASYALGNSNPPYLIIGFSSDSPGEGSNPIGRDSGAIHFNVFLPGDVADVKSGSFDIDVPVSGDVWLTVSAGGYADFRMTRLDIQPALLNCAVLLTRDGSDQHYPIMQPLKGVWIMGPGTSSGITGVLWKSFSNIDGNVAALESSNVIGFSYGLETSDGAYLVNITDVNVYNCQTDYRHRPGSVNAGENIRITRGGFTNSEVAIDNTGGAELNIIHTAIDYNTQAIINNAGIINLSLLRIEQWTPTTEVPIFHCLPGGRITASQIYFLGAGGVGSAPVRPVQLDSALSSMTIDLSTVYNLSSASGFAKSGPGRLDITRLQNSGNPNIGPYMLSDAPAEDVLNSAGLFEPIVSNVAVSADGIYLEGGLFPEAPHTSVDRWNSDITTVSVTTAYAYQGTRCLKVTKADSPDLSINDALHLLIPTRGGNLLGGCRILMPHDQPTTGVIYLRDFWVRVIGHDSLGRPIYGPNQVFKGETDIPVVTAGSLTWILRGFNTLYENDTVDPAKQAGIRPPVWATHLLRLFDHQSNPPMTYYIDALQANEVG